MPLFLFLYNIPKTKKLMNLEGLEFFSHFFTQRPWAQSSVKQAPPLVEPGKRAHHASFQVASTASFWRHHLQHVPRLTRSSPAAGNTSTWLTVTFTLERYVAVCHPMRRELFCSASPISRARRIICIVYFICFMVTLPTPFEWDVVDKVDKEVRQKWA